MKYLACIFLILNIFVVSVFAQTNLLSTNENAETNFFNVEQIGTNINTNNTAPLFLDALQNESRNANTSLTGTFVRSVAGFLFFFALLYIIYRYLKKRSKVVLGADSIIKVLATTPLAQNRYLSIVEIANEMYFIAVADHNITLLSKITDKETIDRVRIAHAKSKDNVVEDPFNSIFDKALSALNIKRKKNVSPLESSRRIKEKIHSLNAETFREDNEESGINITINDDAANTHENKKPKRKR